MKHQDLIDERKKVLVLINEEEFLLLEMLQHKLRMSRDDIIRVGLKLVANKFTELVD
jgi:hypothetical protein